MVVIAQSAELLLESLAHPVHSPLAFDVALDFLESWMMRSSTASNSDEIHTQTRGDGSMPPVVIDGQNSPCCSRAKNPDYFELCRVWYVSGQVVTILSYIRLYRVLYSAS